MPEGDFRQAAGRNVTEMDYLPILRERLTPGRLHHSMEVSREAERLAKKYGAHIQKAALAGLLHDVMKDTDKQAQLQFIQASGTMLSADELSSPKLWHAIAGSIFVKNELEIDDEEVIRAIRYHTTGRAGMSLLEKVLFIADFTSADRDYEDVDEMRRLAEISLEAAMRYGIAFTVRELINQKKLVHTDTIQAYNEVIRGAKEEEAAL